MIAIAKLTRISSYLFMLATLLIATSCTGKNHMSKTPAKTLRLNFQAEPLHLDPRKGGDLISANLQFMLFEGLTRMTKDSTTALGVAERISISPNSREYIFHLRESYWSDGTPVVAEDFQAAWQLMLSPNFPSRCAYLLYPIKNAEEIKSGKAPLSELGVQVIDSKTLKVVLKAPTPYFLELTSFCALAPVPSHIVEQSPDWACQNSQELVSNGPFLLDQWKHKDFMALKKNPLYWDKAAVRLDKIQISFVENENTALEMFARNELDLIGAPYTDLPLDAMKQVKSEENVCISPIAATLFCPMNTKRAPFQNKNIRKAFSFAIDRKSIVDNITQMGEIPALGIIPPVMINHKNFELFSDNDKQLSLQLLEKGLSELGMDHADLGSFTLTYHQNDVSHKIAQALQQYWKENLGIHIELLALDYALWLEKLHTMDFDLALAEWYAMYNDKMDILDRFKKGANAKNYPGWEHAKYISILNESMRIADPEKRNLFLEQAEKILVEEMPFIPIFHRNAIHLKKENLTEVYVSPIGDVYFRNATFR